MPNKVDLIHTSGTLHLTFQVHLRYLLKLAIFWVIRQVSLNFKPWKSWKIAYATVELSYIETTQISRKF